MKHNAQGNTKRSPKPIRSRSWALTIQKNFYESCEEVEKHTNTLKTMKNYIFQEEKGEKTGNIHIQMHVDFKNAKTLAQVKKDFAKFKPHLEPTICRQKYVKYCCKSDTKISKTYTNMPTRGEREFQRLFGASKKNEKMAINMLKEGYEKGYTTKEEFIKGINACFGEF